MPVTLRVLLDKSTAPPVQLIAPALLTLALDKLIVPAEQLIAPALLTLALDKLIVPAEQVIAPALLTIALDKLIVPAEQLMVPVEVIVEVVLSKVTAPPEQLTDPLIEIDPVELKEVPFPVFVTFNVPAIEEDADVETMAKLRPPPWLRPFKVNEPPNAIDSPTPEVLIVIVGAATPGSKITAEALLTVILLTVGDTFTLTVLAVINTTS